MNQETPIKRSISFDMTRSDDSPLDEKSQNGETVMVDDTGNKNKKTKLKRSKDLESELVVKELDQTVSMSKKICIEKRSISKVECLREMDQRNEDLKEKQPSFVLWRYSKESKNYKIGIKKLYLLETKNTGKNKRNQPYKYIPMLQADLLFLENTGSKPYWVLKKTFSSVQEAAQSIMEECRISQKKSFNVYEELSRLTSSSPMVWQSLKEWLPSFYVEKFDIIPLIEDSSDDGEENKKEEGEVSICITPEDSTFDPKILNENKSNEESLYLFHEFDESCDRSSSSDFTSDHDNDPDLFLCTCRSIEFRPFAEFLVS